MLENEYFTGLLGIKFYFGVGKPPAMAKTVAEAAKVRKYIQTRAKAWAAQRAPEQPPKATLKLADYDSLIGLLDNPMDANPDVSKVPDELQLDVVAKYIDIRSWLEANQPALKFSGGLIAQEIPPPDSDKMRFMWAADIINDVSKIFDLLSAGCLTPVEAQVMRDIYPEVGLEIATRYILASIEHLQKTPYSALSGWQMAGLSALAGVPVTSFQDIMSWQMNYEPMGPGRPQGSKAPNLAQNEASDMQALGASV